MRITRSVTMVSAVTIAVVAVACTSSGSNKTASPTPAGPNVTAAAASATSPVSVHLTWSASGANGGTLYKITRNGSSVADVSTTVYEDTGLDPKTTYQYSVAAVDAKGHVSTAATASATTPALPPISQARLQGRGHVLEKYTSVVGITNIAPGKKQREIWVFKPHCDTGACNTLMKLFRPGSSPTTLHRKGASYNGTFHDNLGRCNGTTVHENYTLHITVTKGSYANGEWRATKFKGTLSESAPPQGGCVGTSTKQTVTGSISV